MKYETAEVNGVEFNANLERYVPTLNYVNDVIHDNLEAIFPEQYKYVLEDASSIITGYVLSSRLCYPEDIEKKQYLMYTKPKVVKVLRDAMVSLIQEMILNGRDRVLRGHGIYSGAADANYGKILDKYPFGKPTMDILDRHLYTSRLQRLNYEFVEPSLLGE